MAKLGFNPTEIDTTQRDYEDLPAGVFRFQATAITQKGEYEDEKFSYLFELEVIEPETFIVPEFGLGYTKISIAFSSSIPTPSTKTVTVSVE